MKKAFASIVSFLFLISGLLFASPARAASVCESSWQFAYPGACVMSKPANAAISPTLVSCDDGYGYSGFDYLSYIAFTNIGADAQLAKGQNLSYAARLNQDCVAKNNSYALVVTLVAVNGMRFQGVQSGSTFKYDNPLSAPTLSYCSTEICGSTLITGSIALPINAPGGKYKIEIHMAALNAVNAVNQTFFMGANLSAPMTQNDIPQLPALFNLVGKGGPIICSLGDYTSDAVATYSITGTDFSISENGKVIDTYENLPIATDKTTSTYPGLHGLFGSVWIANQNTMAYSYTVYDQTKGATYDCSASIQTIYGSGPSLTKSVVATVSTKQLNPIVDQSQPTASATPTPSSTSTMTAIPTVGTKKTLICLKGSVLKKVKGVMPKCPKGYKALKVG